jgi:hypothetical protein
VAWLRIAVLALGLLASAAGVVLMVLTGSQVYFALSVAGFALVVLGTSRRAVGRRRPAPRPAYAAAAPSAQARQSAPAVPAAPAPVVISTPGPKVAPAPRASPPSEQGFTARDSDPMAVGLQADNATALPVPEAPAAAELALEHAARAARSPMALAAGAAGAALAAVWASRRRRR